MNKLIVSLSPHVHGGDSVQKNMYGVLIALIPAFLVSLYFFGLGALIVTATSVAACLFFEWAIGKFLMKKEFFLHQKFADSPFKEQTGCYGSSRNNQRAQSEKVKRYKKCRNQCYQHAVHILLHAVTAVNVGRKGYD